MDGKTRTRTAKTPRRESRINELKPNGEKRVILQDNVYIYKK